MQCVTTAARIVILEVVQRSRSLVCLLWLLWFQDHVNMKQLVLCGCINPSSCCHYCWTVCERERGSVTYSRKNDKEDMWLNRVLNHVSLGERNSFWEVFAWKESILRLLNSLVPAVLHLQNALPLFTHAAFIISLHLNLNVLLNISVQTQPEAILWVRVPVCRFSCLYTCVHIS